MKGQMGLMCARNFTCCRNLPFGYYRFSQRFRESDACSCCERAWMPEESLCSVCGEPQRKVAHCSEPRLGLKPCLLGNRVDLLCCSGCGSLWCYANHGDQTAAPAGLIWPYSVADWQRAYDLDDGVSLRRWHLRNIREKSRYLEHPCGRKTCRFLSRSRKQAKGRGAAPAEKPLGL